MSQLLLNMIRRGQTAEIAALVVESPEAARARDAQGVSMLMWTVYTRQPAITEALRAGCGHLDVFEASALGDCARLRETVGLGTFLATRNARAAEAHFSSSCLTRSATLSCWRCIARSSSSIRS